MPIDDSDEELTVKKKTGHWITAVVALAFAVATYYVLST